MRKCDIGNNVPGIYKIICTTNPKYYYIGSSNNIKGRLSSHAYWLRRGLHDSRRFQFVWNKYGGKDNFEWDIIEVCPIDALLTREQFFVDLYKPLLNGTMIVGRPPLTGRKTTLKNFKTNEIVSCESEREFERRFEITPGQTCLLLTGRIKTTGDWCLPSYTPKTYILKYKNEYERIFYSPKEFCKEQKLNVNSVQRVLRRAQDEYKGWHLPNIIYTSREHKSYTFIKLTGEEETVSGYQLKEFAQRNNIKRNDLWALLHTCQKSSGGWYIKDEYVSKYQIIDPHGRLVCFEQIKEFAAKNGLSKSCLSCMLRGKMKTHKGWHDIQKISFSRN